MQIERRSPGGHRGQRLFFGILGALGTVCFSIPLFWRAWNLGGVLALVFSLCLLLGSLFPEHFFGRLSPAGRKRGLRLLWAGMVLLFLWASTLSFCMARGALAGPKEGTSYTVVILGSMVNGREPSADLNQRIRTAETYLREHPEAVAIASGGQGFGEEISEAVAIRDALTARGIDGKRILLEDRSTSTWENVAFSMEIIRQKGLEPRMLLVTDEYHQFRAGQIACAQGVEAAALSAETPWYIFSVCWARELLAITKYLILGF